MKCKFKNKDGSCSIVLKLFKAEHYNSWVSRQLVATARYKEKDCRDPTEESYDINLLCDEDKCLRMKK